MSWRRFMALLSGLSGESLFIHVLSEEKKKKIEIIENTDDILQHMRSQLAKRK